MSYSLPPQVLKAGPPTVNDDASAGFVIGSVIVDTAASPRQAYVCVSTTVGAAVWRNAGGPAGTNTQVQFNDGGSFGGDAGLTYDKATGTLTVGSQLAIPGSTLTANAPALDLQQTWNADTTINVTGASGTGTVATLTFAAQPTAIPVGTTIFVASMNPVAYNARGAVVTASTTTSVSYVSAAAAAYVSGGTVRPVFTGINLRVADTLSNTNSLLMDLQRGGISRFRVGKDGRIVIPDGVAIHLSGEIENTPGVRIYGSGGTGLIFEGNGNRLHLFSNGSIYSRSTCTFNWTNSATAPWSNNVDLTLARDAANVLAQKNELTPSSAQTFRIYNTTDATNTNYERGKVEWSGNVLRIGTESGGTGVARDLAIQTAGTTRLTIRSGGDVVVTGSGGLGYGTGSGGTVTQATSRTTGVTLDKANGAIELVSAAGSATWQSFTVTNSTVAATDTIIVNQKSGADLYMIHVTNVAAGSFQITFATTGGTTTEQPVFNFAVIKAVTA